LIVVITVVAVVAALMIGSLETPVESYFAQSRRADLVDSADRILRSVASDVRTALPNSVRLTAAGGVVALELLAMSGVDFTSGSPTHSVFLVSGPVSYLCDTNARTVRRYSGYTVAAAQSAVPTDAQLMSAGAARSLIAQQVSACNITVVPAPASAKFG